MLKKELVGHLIDGEKVFAYRALRFSRLNKTSLASFDQDFFVENSNFNNVKLADLVKELSLLRQANIIFFNNLASDAWENFGTASNNEVSVRAIAFIMVGHISHHVKILKERYF